jgi:hypothetical protein
MSAFVKMIDKVRNRNFGGTKIEYSCEPYISGYGFIKWYLPPDNSLSPYYLALSIPDSSHQTGSALNREKAEKYLSSACVGITAPNQSITGVTYDASAGIKFESMTKISNGNTLNIKYVEMSGIPIFKIHKAWIEYMRDAKSGFRVNAVNGGLPQNKNDYCGNVLYWTTKPDGITVEFAALYSGIYPTVDPQDSFGFDINSIDKAELDFSYHVDYIFTEPWVTKTAQKYAKMQEYGQNTCWGGFGVEKEKTEIE